MLGPGVFTVFVLGLRHGADPDHLAAIDNVTRSAFERTPRLSKFTGTFFAAGHAAMVLAISAAVGYAGGRLAGHGDAIERAGTWISIAVLLAVAAMNLRALRAGAVRPASIKTRLLPRALRERSSALVALPIGLLFGFGFETSSQVAAYTLAFTADAGIAGALVVGAMFSAGMVCSDTLDSLLVHRLVSFRAECSNLTRIWIGAVSALAVAVALYEMAGALGWRSPLTEIAASAILVAALLGVFAFVMIRTRQPLPLVTRRASAAAAFQEKR